MILSPSLAPYGWRNFIIITCFRIRLDDDGVRFCDSPIFNPRVVISLNTKIHSSFSLPPFTRAQVVGH